MIIATTYFSPEDPTTAPRWAKLLDMWLDSIAATGTSAQPLIITDNPMPNIGCPVFQVDLRSRFRERANGPDHHARMGRTFDRKGLLIAEVLPLLTSDLLYLDMDAFLVRDPVGRIPPTGSFGMPFDAGHIGVRLPHGEQTPYLNAGVLWFPAWTSGGRQLVVDAFHRAFADIALHHPKHTWVEQMAWALACQRLGGHMLKREWNWVPHLYGENKDAYVLHRHGESKWKTLGII